MKTLKYLLFSGILLLIAKQPQAQNLALGQWRAHLPWIKGVSVSDGNGKVYYAAEDGLFSYDKSSGELETHSKVSGLSDKGITLVRYNSSYNLCLITYENSNIDILASDNIINVSDIKRKNIVGTKSINDVTFIGKYAYLACGFGIVVFDLEKLEIRDTYYIGPNGAEINVGGIAYDGSNLFASTDSGVYQININDVNINLYSAWNRILNPVSSTKYNQIVFFNNKLYLRADPTNNSDYLMSYDYTSWSNSGVSLFNIQNLQVTNNKLVVSGSTEVRVYDTNLQLVHDINSFVYPCDIRDAIFDNSGDAWIADNSKGLVQVTPSNVINYYAPEGPRSNSSADIKIVNDQLWVGHSVQGRKWASLNSRDGFSTFVNDHWTTYNADNLHSSIVSLDTIVDFMSLDVDPNNSNHLFLSARGKGVLEFENGAIKNFYTVANSSLQYIIGYYGFCATGGVALDKNNNLWVGNSLVNSPLSELKADGTWQAYYFQVNPPYLDINLSTANTGEVMVDSYGQKWVDFNETGVMVFNEQTNKYQFLNTNAGSGHLPSADVRAMVEDQEGQVWVGTSAGVIVFYNPGAILSGTGNFDGQQVLLLQDENYQYLLETDVVSAIAVDGANRKWFGTEASGVFLMSADGTKQILHFTEENSPLLSNNVTSIGINQKTGEIFFGTDRGICSYRGDATEGGDKCDDYYVFPNPVSHDYHGPIAIQGLVANASVKITDVSGQVVYQTKSKGGLATWDGNNFKGERAKTGIYLVYVTNDDGSATCVTKMLFTN